MKVEKKGTLFTNYTNSKEKLGGEEAGRLVGVKRRSRWKRERRGSWSE